MNDRNGCRGDLARSIEDYRHVRRKLPAPSKPADELGLYDWAGEVADLDEACYKVFRKNDVVRSVKHAIVRRETEVESNQEKNNVCS